MSAVRWRSLPTGWAEAHGARARPGSGRAWPATVEAHSPYVGELPAFRAYDDDRSLRRVTSATVETLRERDLPLADIAVLSARGHGRSLLIKGTKLGTLGLEIVVRRAAVALSGVLA